MRNKNLIVGLMIQSLLLIGCTQMQNVPETNFKPYYAEGYYHNYTNPQTITISVSDTYYNITNMNEGNYYGLVFHSDGLNITKTALYDLDVSASFTGGNSGLYEFELFVNNNGNPDCVFFRTTTTTNLGNAGTSCLLNLTQGDHLVMKVKDINPPAQNINLYNYNFKIVEVRNG